MFSFTSRENYDSRFWWILAQKHIVLTTHRFSQFLVREIEQLGTHKKYRLFEDWISNGMVFKGSALAMVPTIQKLDHSYPDTFVWITDGFRQKGGHLSEFQTTLFVPFEIQTFLDVRFPLFYCHVKFGPFESWESDG